MIQLNTVNRRRRPSLTPMIDVVFLLLIFFMLVARFGVDKVIDINLPSTLGHNSKYEGAPRLVEIQSGKIVSLNGLEIPLDKLSGKLRELMPSPNALIILRSSVEANTQDLLDVLLYLKSEKIMNVSVLGADNEF
ncbi:MAG: biopolymer transporter ExbD [Paracoccaceae bacterium]|jgi:biopolymer transport protein ExbD